MHTKSYAQQKAVDTALAAKRGEPEGDLKCASKEMHETMTEAELENWPPPAARQPEHLSEK